MYFPNDSFRGSCVDETGAAGVEAAVKVRPAMAARVKDRAVRVDGRNEGVMGDIMGNIRKLIEVFQKG